jgi:glucose/arabinose dehydrogenase
MRPLIVAAALSALLLSACGPAAETPNAGVSTAAAVQTQTPQSGVSTPAAAVPTAATAAPSAPAPPSAPAVLAPTAGPIDTLALGLELVADGFRKPLYATGAGDGSDRLFVVEQGGKIWIVRDGKRLDQPFLDVSDLVGAQGNEQGLLSVAFHPRYAESGALFVDYTDRRGDTVVARYRASADPDLADPASAEVLLKVDQPAANHNGGLLTFGPDGYLYVGLGDGGGAGDTYGNGQNLGTLLGSILRLDVDGSSPYAIPADNPFVGRADARPEIWAWGLRNPWRFSFDRATGDLYIADVGQNQYEEVSVQPAGSPGGQNYGWNTTEGASCFRAPGCDQAGLTMPVAVYDHGAQGGCSITGGYVYRGAAFPQLAGIYLYADYCTGHLWAMARQGDTWASRQVGQADIQASSFGEDDAGELYLTDHGGGTLYRLVARGGA